MEVLPLGGPIDARPRVPGSKSMTNRALVLAALAQGATRIENALQSDDTDRMVDCLRALEFTVAADPTQRRMTVDGLAGAVPAEEADLYVGASGTCARFLTALAALGRGTYRIDGVPRMRERPILPLLDALRSLGIGARDEFGTGCPPVRIGGGPPLGGSIALDASISSQYVSALLMIAPLLVRGLTLRLEGEIISRPYIAMTLQQMARHGVDAAWVDDRTIAVPGARAYVASTQAMESDASSASYFFAAAAVTGGRATVERLPRDSIQGDLAILNVLETMGCHVSHEEDAVTVQGPSRLRGGRFDANSFPDMGPTLAALAPFAEGPVEVHNVASMRVKETDRIAAVVAECRRLGQEVTEGQDWFRIVARPIVPALVRTYDDHRMAMAFSVVGLRAPGVRILDPDCVAKTYPEYWDALRGAGVALREYEVAEGASARETD